jgi:hypothetical protein
VFAGGEPVLADPPRLRAKMRAPEVRDEVALAAGAGGTGSFNLGGSAAAAALAVAL